MEVARTGPGASSTHGMTTCRPLPMRGGPTSSAESSTEHQSSRPRTRPTRNPTSSGAGCGPADGRTTVPLRTRGRLPAAAAASAAVASPGRLRSDRSRSEPAEPATSRHATTTAPAASATTTPVVVQYSQVAGSASGSGHAVAGSAGEPSARRASSGPPAGAGLPVRRQASAAPHHRTAPSPRAAVPPHSAHEVRSRPLPNRGSRPIGRRGGGRRVIPPPDPRARPGDSRLRRRAAVVKPRPRGGRRASLRRPGGLW